MPPRGRHRPLSAWNEASAIVDVGRDAADRGRDALRRVERIGRPLLPDVDADAELVAAQTAPDVLEADAHVQHAGQRAQRAVRAVGQQPADGAFFRDEVVVRFHETRAASVMSRVRSTGPIGHATPSPRTVAPHSSANASFRSLTTSAPESPSAAKGRLSSVERIKICRGARSVRPCTTADVENAVSTTTPRVTPVMAPVLVTVVPVAAALHPEAVGTVNSWVTKGAIFEFENAVHAASVVTSPMEQAVLDPEQLQALKYMMIITGSLDTILGQNLAAALGLSVGFSALDGD